MSTALQGNSPPSGEKSPCLPPLASREPVGCCHRALRENAPTSTGSSDHSPKPRVLSNRLLLGVAPDQAPTPPPGAPSQPCPSVPIVCPVEALGTAG